ncbi:Uncharacterised protein [Serratia fonticola]|uniref:Uncharacterized protein n=1 Tax=Serratia fonticola TaxID=47917 RepID=A0A4U9V1W2_SERFO|nr:Uncharacterised protein [Serratia fonticola]
MPIRRCWKRWRVSWAWILAAFIAEMRLNSGAPTAQHIADSRALLAKVRGHGFPTFALEDNQGRLSQIPVQEFLGNVEGWKALLKDAVK